MAKGDMMRADASDAIGGALLVVFGIFVVVYVDANYSLGSMFRMGPGMFPLLLGALLILLGSIISIAAFYRTAPPPRFDIRPFLAVILSMVLFAVLLPLFGLVPAVLAMVAAASFGDERPDLRVTVALAAFLALLVVLIFRVGLGIRIVLINWPWG